MFAKARRWLWTGWAIACVGSWAGGVWGGTPPAGQSAAGGTQIQLHNSRWQTLPRDILLAYTGPDGRMWYVSGGREGPGETDAIKAQIQAAWKEPAPVLRGVRPALFEKNSHRIWFITADQRTLLGFDGSRWIEQTTHAGAALDGGFIGDDPAHGHSTQTPVNVDLGDRQVFAESTGFVVFDGSKWSELNVSSHDNGPLMLLAMPSGNGVIALQAGPAHAWLLKGTEWSPIAIGDFQDGVQSAAVTESGTLLLQNPSGGIRQIDIVQNPRAGEDFSQAIKDLKSSDPTVASVALQRILSNGVAAIPTLNRAMAEAPDAASRVQLALIVQRISASAGQQQTGANGPPPSVYSDGTGVLWRAAVGMPGQPGTAILNSAMLQLPGKFSVIVTDVPRFNFYAPWPAPMAGDGGKTWWIGTKEGAQRVDVSRTPPEVTHLPDRTYVYPQAVGGAGRVILSDRPPDLSALQVDQPHLPLMVYTPGAPEDRRVLKSEAMPADDSFSTLSSDGTLWTALADKGIARFDGKTWTAVYDVHYQGTQLFAGKNGSVLSWQGKWFTLFDGDKQLESHSLDDFVRENADEFAAAFGGFSEAALFRRTGSLR